MGPASARALWCPLPAVAEEERMSERRLIGIDLAWGNEGGIGYYSTECEGSGCAELVWDGEDLMLKRLALLHSMDEIVDWIRPDCGDWVVAIDAPLVICNKDGQRPAENQASKFYGKYHAGADSSNLKREHRGPQLLRALARRGGELVEQTVAIRGRRLVFETYPHIAMVELFNLDRIFKHKRKPKRTVACRNAEQRRLAEATCENLCSEAADPFLMMNKRLAELLPEPFPDLGGQALKDREDKLDGLICAYTTAWLNAGRDLVGLGKVGEGVMIAPRVQGIGPLLP